MRTCKVPINHLIETKKRRKDPLPFPCDESCWMTLDAAPKREAGSDRRMAIASAARSLVAEKGFEGLRSRDIAERVGLNIATLTYHVPTREALIALMARPMREEFVAQHFARPREGLFA